MSLLDDLGAIDVSIVVDAKGLLTLALQSEELQGLIDDGPAKSVMGQLGTVISQVEGDFENPEALIAPLLEVIGTLAQEIRFDDGAVNQITSLVADGTRIVAAALGGLSGDLNQMQIAGKPVSGALAEAAGPVGDFALRAVGVLGRHRALLNVVEGGLPSDPSALAEIALDILLPFSRSGLMEAKGQITTVMQGLDGLALPTTRLNGLNTALVEISLAARAGNPAAVQAALDRLERLKTEAIGVIAGDMRALAQSLSALHLDQSLRAVGALRATLNTSDIGIVEELEEWRGQLTAAGRLVENFDPAQARDGIRAILDLLEREAESIIDAGVDAQVAKLEAWLRGLLRELPLRPIREDISRALAEVARRIEAADIDRVATEIRGGIETLAKLLAEIDLQALIDTATAALADAIRAALDQVEATLGVITAQIEALAAQVSAILTQASTGIGSFREAVDAVEALVGEANIEQATRDVVDALAALRAKAEELLTIVPLPEEMRPIVEQLAAQVRAIDVAELIGKPMREAAAVLQIPDEVGTTVQDGLQALSDTLENLIPDNIAADLQAELDGLFTQLQNIDLSSLTSGISGELDRVAGAIEAVDIVALAAPASEAFDQVLAAFDRIRPSILLRPAIEAYDNLLGQIPVPNPDDISTRASQVVSTAGEAAARAITQPMQTAVGASSAPGTGGDAGSSAPAEIPPSDIRPGDFIRLVGFLPAKLREGLQALDSGAAGDAMREIQGACGGLAADIRRLQRAITEIENNAVRQLDEMLDAYSTAHLDAQLALAGGFRAQAGPLDVDLSLSLVASVGPGGLRQSLVGDIELIESRASDTLRVLGGGLGNQLDEIADILESCALARFGEDLGALLDALDPEPIAAEFDAVFVAILEKASSSLIDIQADLEEVYRRIRQMIDRYNPGAQAQKLLRVLSVLREELDLLNPRRLADELEETHAAIRAALAAYDPEVFATDLNALLATTAAAVRGLDPANLTPDLTAVQAQIDRVPGLLPLDALASVGAGLDAVGTELSALDVPGMVATVNGIAPSVAEAIEESLEAVQAEVLALLGAIEYASGSASASVSVSVGGD